jgi:hypothetical protein
MSGFDPIRTPAWLRTTTGMRSIAAASRVVAFIAEAAPADRLSPRTARLGPMPDWDLLGQTEPDVEFDHRVSW